MKYWPVGQVGGTTGALVVVTGTALVVASVGGTVVAEARTVVTGHTTIGQPLRQPHSFFVTLDLFNSHPVGGGMQSNIGHGLHLEEVVVASVVTGTATVVVLTQLGKAVHVGGRHGATKQLITEQTSHGPQLELVQEAPGSWVALVVVE